MQYFGSNQVMLMYDLCSENTITAFADLTLKCNDRYYRCCWFYW